MTYLKLFRNVWKKCRPNFFWKEIMPGTRRWVNTYLIKARQNLRQKSGKIPHQVLFSSDKLYQQLSKLLYLCDAFYKFFCLLIIWRIVYGKLLSTHYKCKENLHNRFEIAHHLLFSLLICSANICEFLYNFCYGQIFTFYSKYPLWINSFHHNHNSCIIQNILFLLCW